LNLFISDIQPFAGLLFIIAILPRIPSGAIDIKSLQDFKKHLITEKLNLLRKVIFTTSARSDPEYSG
ncbi:MAG: hypothetical protein Q8S54_14570, partial [Bacteroidota bacterium]|nr:hypothetical protein [Bacteroidota bacterium]